MTRKHTWPIRLLCLLLVLALAPLQVLAEEWPGMDAFGLPEELPTPPFTDVSVMPGTIPMSGCSTLWD